MKKIIGILIAVLSSVQVFADQTGGDQENTLVKCTPAVLVPDAGFDISVSSGGLSGLTMIRVSRYFLGHSTVTNLIAQNSKSLNGIVSYSGSTGLGKDIRFYSLTVRTTHADKNNAFAGTFSTKQGQGEEGNSSWTREALKCVFPK